MNERALLMRKKSRHVHILPQKCPLVNRLLFASHNRFLKMLFICIIYLLNNLGDNLNIQRFSIIKKDYLPKVLLKRERNLQELKYQYCFKFQPGISGTISELLQLIATELHKCHK